MMNVLGYLPHKNWQESYMENADKVGGIIMRENHHVDDRYMHLPVLLAAEV